MATHPVLFAEWLTPCLAGPDGIFDILPERTPPRAGPLLTLTAVAGLAAIKEFQVRVTQLRHLLTDSRFSNIQVQKVSKKPSKQTQKRSTSVMSDECLFTKTNLDILRNTGYGVSFI